MSDAELGGVAATRVRVQLPAWGRWWADIDTVDDTVLTGAQALKLPGMTLVGTVYGAPYEGRGRYRLVGGAGGWSKQLKARAYLNDLGVRKSTVLSDLATETGETVDDLPDTRFSAHFARVQGPAFVTLNSVAPKGWHTDLAGVTRITTWPASTYSGEATITDVDEASQIVELTTDDLEGLVPGVTLSTTVGDVGPASDVEIEIDTTSIKVRVLASQQLTRRLEAFSAMLDALDPRRRYRGTYEYRVVEQTDNRVSLQIARVGSGMGDLSLVRIRPGIPGASFTLVPGALVLVSFIDGDPSRPAIVSFDDPDAPGHSPTVLNLDSALVTIGDTDGSTDFVALAAATNAQLVAIRDLLSGNELPTPLWTPLAFDGGLALQVAAKALWVLPGPAPGSVAATNVKGS